MTATTDDTGARDSVNSNGSDRSTTDGAAGRRRKADTLNLSAPLPAGAALLATDAIRRLTAAAPHALARRRIVAVSGPTGCGKTTALDVLANTLAARGKRVVTVVLAGGLTDKQVIAHVYKAIHRIDGKLPAAMRRDDLMTDLRHDLASDDIVLLLDEAQNASLAALELLRMLHEDPTASCGLVIAGAGLERKLAGDPMLNNRIALRVKVSPLPPEQLADALPQLHPLLGAYTPAQLLAADTAFCHGELRRWTMLLEWLTTYGANADDDPDDLRDTLAKSLDLLTGTSAGLA